MCLINNYGYSFKGMTSYYLARLLLISLNTSLSISVPLILIKLDQLSATPEANIIKLPPINTFTIVKNYYERTSKLFIYSTILC